MAVDIKSDFVSRREFTDQIDEAGRNVSQIALNWVRHRPTISTLVIGAFPATIDG